MIVSGARILGLSNLSLFAGVRDLPETTCAREIKSDKIMTNSDEKVEKVENDKFVYILLKTT